jgi:hypothetical protein
MLKNFLNRKIKELKDMQKAHYDSTYPMDDYFTGMYNGMEFIISCISGEEPNYKTVEVSKIKTMTEHNMEKIK